MRKYKLTLKHDGGTVVIITRADSTMQAIQKVCAAEKAPASAVISCRPLPSGPWQPKLGKCGCRRGIQRDNCAACEGTGWLIDFAAIRAAKHV